MTKSLVSYNNNISRLASYVGFAKKARNIHFGSDKVLASAKKAAIIVSRDISDNTLNKLNNHAMKKNVSVVLVDSSIMTEIKQSDKIKVFQILDENLEKAIINGLKLLEDTTLE